MTIAQRRGLRGVDPGDPGVRRAATTRRGSRSRWRAASTAGWSSCAPACQERGQDRTRIPGAPNHGSGGRAGTTCVGDGRTAGCGRPRPRTRRRATGISPSRWASTSWYPIACRAVRDSAPRASRPRTSSTRPAPRIAANRRSMRSCQDGPWEPHTGDADREHRGARTPGGPAPNDENGRPVMLDHLERPRDPPGVAGLDARRGGGVDALQLGVGGGEALGRRGTASSIASRTVAVLRREGERVDHRLHVQTGAADEQRARARDARCRRSRRVLRAGTAPPTTRRRARPRRPGGAGPRRARPGWAWPSRCRGRGRPASSRSTRSRRRRTPVPPRARAPTCPTRWGRRSPGAARSRRRGGDGDADAGPTRGGLDREQVAAQPVRRGAGDADVGRRRRPRARARPARSARACSGGCAPTTSSGSFFDGPSTSTVSVRPTRASCFASA